MKKLIITLLTLMLLVSLCACGGSQPAPANSEISTVQDLIDNNYMNMSYTIQDGSFRAFFVSEDMSSSYYLLTAPTTSAVEEAYEALDILDDDYDEKLNNFLLSLDKAKLENLNDRIPDEAELKRLVGKTLGELQDEGFEENSSFYSEDEVSFSYGNRTYIVDLAVDPDSLKNDDPCTYVVTKSEFWMLDPNIIFE